LLVEPLDLHGHTLSDAMRRFVGRYNAVLAAAGGEARGIEVIHGKGTASSTGLIREELRIFLAAHGKRITGFDVQLVLRGSAADLDKYRGKLAYIHGEDIDRNGGKTIVIPRQRLRLADWHQY
jgi:hypothetical protein